MTDEDQEESAEIRGETKGQWGEWDPATSVGFGEGTYSVEREKGLAL